MDTASRAELGDAGHAQHGRDRPQPVHGGAGGLGPAGKGGHADGVQGLGQFRLDAPRPGPRFAGGDVPGQPSAHVGGQVLRPVGAEVGEAHRVQRHLDAREPAGAAALRPALRRHRGAGGRAPQGGQARRQPFEAQPVRPEGGGHVRRRHRHAAAAAEHEHRVRRLQRRPRLDQFHLGEGFGRAEGEAEAAASEGAGGHGAEHGAAELGLEAFRPGAVQRRRGQGFRPEVERRFPGAAAQRRFAAAGQHRARPGVARREGQAGVRSGGSGRRALPSPPRRTARRRAGGGRHRGAAGPLPAATFASIRSGRPQASRSAEADRFTAASRAHTGPRPGHTVASWAGCEARQRKAERDAHRAPGGGAVQAHRRAEPAAADRRGAFRHQPARIGAADVDQRVAERPGPVERRVGHERSRRRSRGCGAARRRRSSRTAAAPGCAGGPAPRAARPDRVARLPRRSRRSRAVARRPGRRRGRARTRRPPCAPAPDRGRRSSTVAKARMPRSRARTDSVAAASGSSPRTSPSASRSLMSDKRMSSGAAVPPRQPSQAIAASPISTVAPLAELLGRRPFQGARQRRQRQRPLAQPQGEGGDAERGRDQQREQPAEHAPEGAGRRRGLTGPAASRLCSPAMMPERRAALPSPTTATPPSGSRRASRPAPTRRGASPAARKGRRCSGRSAATARSCPTSRCASRRCCSTRRRGADRTRRWRTRSAPLRRADPAARAGRGGRCAARGQAAGGADRRGGGPRGTLAARPGHGRAVGTGGGGGRPRLRAPARRRGRRAANCGRSARDGADGHGRRRPRGLRPFRARHGQARRAGAELLLGYRPLAALRPGRRSLPRRPRRRLLCPDRARTGAAAGRTHRRRLRLPHRPPPAPRPGGDAAGRLACTPPSPTTSPWARTGNGRR